MAKKKTNDSAASLVPLQTGNLAAAAKQEVGVIQRAFNTLPEVIRDDDVSVAYADFMVKLAAYTKSVDRKEKSITKHLNAAKKIVTDLFKPHKSKLKWFREQCDERLLDYQDFLARKAEEERRKEGERERKRLAKLEANKKKALKAAPSAKEKARVEARYAGKVEQVQAETDAALEMIEEEPPEAPGVQFRTQLKIEVVDINEVRDEFVVKTLDWAKVRGYVLRMEEAHGKLPTLKGLKIYRENTTAVRGG